MDSYLMAIDVALGDGVCAAAMSRMVRKLLNNPTALFRRVRDKNGQLRLSQNAKNYHPGRGVYRSAYRNALRLTATETNMAYRTADHTRWQQLNFVTGIEIKLSNNHNCRGIAKGQFYDICDELAGVYPKDFKFVGWHPFCRCFAIPKLADMNEFLEYQDKFVAGEDVSGYKFSGEVTQMPKQFNEWIKANEKRIKSAKSLPYFIRDNYVGGDISKGLVFASKPLTTLERAAIRHAQRTQKQIDDIKRRNTERLNTYRLIDKTANNILKVANEYAEVDVTTLKMLIAKRDMFAIKAETQKVTKQIAEVKKARYTPTNVSKEISFEEATKHWRIRLDNAEYNNSIANKIQWVEFKKDLDTATEKYGIKLSDYSCVITKDKVQLWVEGNGFSLERTFSFLEDGRLDVHHDYFEIDKKYQGKGLSKDIFKALYKQYKRIGVNQMTVFANIDVGGYTWAKYGFSTRNKVSALRAVRSEKAKSFIEEYYTTNNLADSEKFPMILIAKNFGKEELLGKNWLGLVRNFRSR